MVSSEAERRYRLVREAAEREGVDAVIAAGSEYTGFEGAVRYLSDFDIVHRYAHVLLPLDEEPTLVFPAEARFVGEHEAAGSRIRSSPTRPASGCASASRRAAGSGSPCTGSTTS